MLQTYRASRYSYKKICTLPIRTCSAVKDNLFLGSLPFLAPCGDVITCRWSFSPPPHHHHLLTQIKFKPSICFCWSRLVVVRGWRSVAFYAALRLLLLGLPASQPTDHWLQQCKMFSTTTIPFGSVTVISSMTEWWGEALCVGPQTYPFRLGPASFGAINHLKPTLVKRCPSNPCKIGCTFQCSMNGKENPIIVNALPHNSHQHHHHLIKVITLPGHCR